MKLLKELLESKQEHKEVELVLERYKHDDRFEKLYNKMVPDEGEAETEYGEAVRAIARLEYDYYNNGYQNAVDVRITLESKDNDFNDQISNLDEYLDYVVKKIGSDRSKSRKWYEYYNKICASGNENSGEINSESDFEDAAAEGAEALVHLIDELKSHEEIYNGDDEDDEYGWIPMDGKYTSLDSYEIEHMFETIEKGLDDIHSVLDFNIEERDTWYKTELYDHLMRFAKENDAPSRVIAAIRYIEPRAALLSDNSDDDRFYDSTSQIKTWLVSLFESKKNTGDTLLEGSWGYGPLDTDGSTGNYQYLLDEVSKLLAKELKKENKRKFDDNGFNIYPSAAGTYIAAKKLYDSLQKMDHFSDEHDIKQSLAELEGKLANWADATLKDPEVNSDLKQQLKSFRKTLKKSLKESNDNRLYNGATVIIKKDSPYYDGRSEEFVVSQLDTERGRCWIGDKDTGRGWYIHVDELEIVDSDDAEYDEDGNLLY